MIKAYMARWAFSTLTIVCGNFVSGLASGSAYDGQSSQKLYNWPKMLSPPHYGNGVHRTV